MDKIKFHERLKELRNYHGFSQKELSEEIEIPYNSLIKYETGDRRPNFDTIIRLARYYDVPIDYLMGVSNYTVSRFDYDFMQQLLGLYSQKTIDYLKHFIKIDLDQLGIDNKKFVNKDKFKMDSYTMIFGILSAITLDEDSSLEDYNDDELGVFTKKIDLICNILFELYDSKKPELPSLDELSSLLLLVRAYKNDEFSFSNIAETKKIDSSNFDSKEDRLKLIESYVDMNNTNNQKILRMLNELENENKRSLD